jgi:hypothetical protein
MTKIVNLYPKPLELQLGGKGTQPVSLDILSATSVTDWGE